MIPRRASHCGRRQLRILANALLPLAVVMCLNDRPLGPGAIATASLRLRQVGRNTTVCGAGPSFTVAKARVLLKARGRTDSTVAVGNFVGDTVTLRIEVPLGDAVALFDITAQAIDAANDTIFRAADSITVLAGGVTTVRDLQLWYATPDSGLVFLTIAPRDTSVRVNSQFAMRAFGVDGSDAAIAGPIHLGFLSRDPSVVAIGPSGAVTAQGKGGSAWIIASSWLGVCDSTTVIVLPPVASVTLTPDTSLLVRDGTVQIVAVLKDAGGTQLFNRVITWSSNNVNASVDATGLVRALVANRSARITATSEGVSASAGVGVLPKPVGKVTITPKTGAVIVGNTIPLSAVAYDSAGAVNGDYPVGWTSLAPTLATVSATGVVTGVATGSALITASANGSADTATITLSAAGVTSVTVSPSLDSLLLGESAQLTAVVKDAAGTVLPAAAVTWTTSDANIATVSTTGFVTDVGPGTATITAASGGVSGTATVLQPPAASMTAIDHPPALYDRFVYAYIGGYGDPPCAIDTYGDSVRATSSSGDFSASRSVSYGQFNVNPCATTTMVGTSAANVTSREVGGRSLIATGAAITSAAGAFVSNFQQADAWDGIAFLLDYKTRYTISGSVTVDWDALGASGSVRVWLVGAAGAIANVTVFRVDLPVAPGSTGSETYPFTQSGIMAPGQYNLDIESHAKINGCSRCAVHATFDNVVLQLTP